MHQRRGGALPLKAAFTPRNGVTIAGYYWRQRAPTQATRHAMRERETPG